MFSILAAFVAAAPAPITIVAFGDSTTAERKDTVVYPTLLQTALAKKGIAVEVVNSGYGAHTTAMARVKFQAGVLDKKPAVVVIQLGINDAAVDVWKKTPADKPRVDVKTYEENLRFFVTTLKKAGARPILMTPNPLRWTPEVKKRYGKPPYRIADPDGLTFILADYAEVVRKLAKAEDVPLVDVYAAFRKIGGPTGAGIDALLSDGVHPNSKGHELVAETLLPALLAEIPKARRR